MTQFILKINLGNDAMQTGYDVSNALLAVCNKIQYEDNIKGYEERIMDLNGNTVGSWQVK